VVGGAASMAMGRQDTVHRLKLELRAEIVPEASKFRVKGKKVIRNRFSVALSCFDFAPNILLACFPSAHNQYEEGQHR
jgi:hypothetical protein